MKRGITMDVFFWIVDLLIPIGMVAFGLLFKFKPPKKINILYGYRTARSMKSQEAWDYAHSRIATIWINIGVALFFGITLSKLFTPVSEEYLSLVHIGIGIIALFIGIPFIEKDLKTKYDDNKKSYF
jgi:uncharacterized membrane protein